MMPFFGAGRRDDAPPMPSEPAAGARWFEPSLSMPWVLIAAFVACLCFDLLRRAFFVRRHTFRGRHVLVTGKPTARGQSAS